MPSTLPSQASATFAANLIADWKFGLLESTFVPMCRRSGHGRNMIGPSCNFEIAELHLDQKKQGEKTSSRRRGQQDFRRLCAIPEQPEVRGRPVTDTSAGARGRWDLLSTRSRRETVKKCFVSFRLYSCAGGRSNPALRGVAGQYPPLGPAVLLCGQLESVNDGPGLFSGMVPFNPLVGFLFNAHQHLFDAPAPSSLAFPSWSARDVSRREQPRPCGSLA